MKEMEMHKDIAKHLGMNEVTVIEPERERQPVAVNEELEEDLDQARRDIKEIAQIGMQAVAEAAKLADQSQHDNLYMHYHQL